MTNSINLNKINQLFHNNGIKQELRFDLLINLLETNNTNGVITEQYKEITNIISQLDYSNKDLIQEMFMLIGNKMTKFKLDQFYTPLTISEFISNFMIISNTHIAIDPAGGTGDLLLYYSGAKHIWDIDDNALKLCKLNYELFKLSNYTLFSNSYLFKN